jgi:hypothetical protein
MLLYSEIAGKNQDIILPNNTNGYLIPPSRVTACGATFAAIQVHRELESTLTLLVYCCGY